MCRACISLFLIEAPLDIVDDSEYEEEDESECDFDCEYSLIIVYALEVAVVGWIDHV